MSAKQLPGEEQDALIEGLERVGDHESLAPLEKAILKYATKLTRTPARMTGADIEQLRAHDLDDRGIHDICAITAYFAFVNRMADGLGVELEERFDEIESEAQ